MFLMPRHQTGFTLIELLIGGTLGLIVAAGAISLFVIGLQGQGNNVKLARLNQDLRAMMDIMTRDIRRAGFVTSNTNNTDELKNNIFFSTASGSSTDLRIYAGDFTTLVTTPGSPGPCIVYAYNENDDNPPTVDAGERYGFRRNATDGLVEMRTGTTTHNDDCNDGTWGNTTEPEVEITVLEFRLSESTLDVTSMSTDTDGDGCLDGDDANPTTASSTCKTAKYGNGLCDTGESCNTCTRDGSPPDPACLYIRTVGITLTGRLRDDTSITQTITEQVRVRNDKFLDAIP